jgi:hypothetical protein
MTSLIVLKLPFSIPFATFTRITLFVKKELDFSIIFLTPWDGTATTIQFDPSIQV